MTAYAQIGIQQELVRAFISSFTLVLFPYYTIIILMDWGVVEGQSSYQKT
jgi:hypothetical protein